MNGRSPWKALLQFDVAGTLIVETHSIGAYIYSRGARKGRPIDHRCDLKIDTKGINR